MNVSKKEVVNRDFAVILILKVFNFTIVRARSDSSVVNINVSTFLDTVSKH